MKKKENKNSHQQNKRLKCQISILLRTYLQKTTTDLNIFLSNVDCILKKGSHMKNNWQTFFCWLLLHSENYLKKIIMKK
jgi:hypothetical protein